MSDEQRVLTVTANPAIDQTLEIPGFAADKVNRVQSSRMDAGGKGINVATILGDLGVPTAVTGFLGSENTAVFERHFAEHGLQDRFVHVSGATRIGIKVVNPENHETTDINFPGLTIGAGEYAHLLRTVEELVVSGGWHVLSGSLPCGLDANFYADLIGVIRGKGGRVVLDTSGEPLCRAISAEPEVVKPNREELAELIGAEVHTVEDAIEAADHLLKGHTQMVVVSMGGEGAVFVNREKALTVRPPHVEVRSTVGAGDTMVAGIVRALQQGMNLEETARLATAFGAYAVSRYGAGIEMQAVEPLLAQVEICVAHRKAAYAAVPEGV